MTTNAACDADVALWMLAQLPSRTQARVRRRLTLRLDPPASPEAEDRDELRLLIGLLHNLVPASGWSFAIVPRRKYAARRSMEDPSSRALVKRYGSWASVCRNAYGLATGKRKRLDGDSRRKAARRYSDEELTAAVVECARELERTPSSSAYAAWHSVTKRRRRLDNNIPSYQAINRRFRERGGWIAALEAAEVQPSPEETVRISAKNSAAAKQLAANARQLGFAAAHAGNRCWAEVHTTLLRLKETMANHPALFEEARTLWVPHSNTFERCP